MAILKKGSKGKEVETLQGHLNAAGARPKLKEDGIFGPVTEAAVKAFQKRCRMTVDGKVGPETAAAAKHGGPLPEMTVEDYRVRREEFHKSFLVARQDLDSYDIVQKEARTLSEIADKNVPEARKLIMANNAHWEQVVARSDKIIANQDLFLTLRLSNPAKAEILVKQCEDLDKQVNAIGSAKIMPNRRKALDMLAAVKTKLRSSVKVMEAELSAIDKRNA